MRPKTYTTVTRLCNQVQVGVSVQIFTEDLSRRQKRVSVELLIACSSCVCRENIYTGQRIEKLMPVATIRHK